MSIRKLNWNKVIIVLVMPILLIILTVNTVSTAVSKKDSDKDIKQTVTDIAAYKDLTLIHNQKESDYFTSSITSPKIHKDIIDKEIDNWISNKEKEFEKKVNKNKNEFNDDFKANLDINTEVLEVTDNIVTFVLNHSEFINNENDHNTIKTFVVDLNESEIIESDKINKLLNNKELLYKLVDDSLKKEQNIYSLIDHDKLKKSLNAKKDLTWSLNQTNFRLHFDKGEIESDIQEALTVNIPLVNLDGNIDEQLAEKLNIKEFVRIEKEKEEEYLKEAKRIKEEEKRKYEEKMLEDKMQKERAKNLKPLDKQEKYVALTFDDGPNPDVTPRVLKYLDEYDAVATFYMLGSQAKKYPKTARAVANRGHEIASHSVTHADLSNVSASKVHTEMTDATNLIEQATGVKPRTFRPPYGAINQNVINKARDINQPIILWSVDSLDWKYPNANSVYSKVMNNMHSGAIVLMHDIHPTTADALPSILKDLKNKGYKFVTVTDLLQLTGNEDIGPYNSKKSNKSNKE